MQFRLTFKTPDVTERAFSDDMTEDEREQVEAVLNKFIKWGECVTIEFDTETKTAEVVKLV